MREFHEIPRPSEESEEEIKNLYANEAAAMRMRKWKKQTELHPEAGLEAGQESESGKNDKNQSSTEQQPRLSREEMAAMRLQRMREELQQANEIREKLGIPTKEE